MLDGLDGVGEAAGAGCDLLGCELFGCGASMIAFLAVGLGYWWL